jgi:hypothetical protein
MNHTSGLPEYFDIADRTMTLTDTLDNDKALAMLAENLTYMPIQARGILAWRYARVQIQDVCRERQVQLGSLCLDLPSKLRCGLKLDRFT